MVPRFPPVAVAALTLLPLLFAAPAAATQGPRDGAPDRLIVAYDSGSDSGDRANALHNVHARSTRSLASLGNTDAITVADGTAASAVAKLNHTDGVAWAEVDRPVRAAAAMSVDPGWTWQLWSNFTTFLGGVQHDFTTAWASSSIGSPAAPIAVVDTGVDFTIDDLRENRVDGGWDFLKSDAYPSDENDHGTAVAGIAAASTHVYTDNDITGGAPDAGVMALRVLGADGSGLMSNVANAFAWAGDHGVRVVNASLTSVGPSQAVAAAITAHPNTLYVVAAGNSASNEDTLANDKREYPCALDLANVICVAAVDGGGNLASFSNYGRTTVDVGAPGTDIRSYVIGGNLKQDWDGTSMATPFVAAAAELAVAQTPTVTAPQLHDAIISTRRPLAALADKTTSGGMINADELLTRVTQLPVVAPPTPPAPPAPPAQPPATPAPPATAPPAHGAPSKAPALRSPQLKLGHVSRSGSRLRVTGTLARAWKGTVTVTVCAGRHCTHTRTRVSNGRFTAKLKVARGRHVKITVTAPAVRGYRALHITRSARS